jgi:hypothetical protein
VGEIWPTWETLDGGGRVIRFFIFLGRDGAIPPCTFSLWGLVIRPLLPGVLWQLSSTATTRLRTRFFLWALHFGKSDLNFVYLNMIKFNSIRKIHLMELRICSQLSNLFNPINYLIAYGYCIQMYQLHIYI